MGDGKEMPRLYRYVGPHEIRKRVEGMPPGAAIRSAADLAAFVETSGASPIAGGLVPLTFVVMGDGELRVALRGSEHVACAGGAEVLTAGELFVARDLPGEVRIEEASNQSTGFCPEPTSWPALAIALDRANVRHPGRFTQEIVFRRCTMCNERNLVKEDWFVCALCDAPLPAEWNF